MGNTHGTAQATADDMAFDAADGRRLQRWMGVAAFGLTLSCPLAGEAQAPMSGAYRLVQGGQCVAGGASGETLALAACDDGDGAQTWQLIDHGGPATFQNWESGLVIDVSGNSGTPGAPLISWQSLGQDNQRFELSARGDAFALSPRIATDQCVTVSAGALALAPCDGGNGAQAFALEAVAIETPDDVRDCLEGELLVPRFVDNDSGGPTGANVGIVTGGYLMVLFAPDSGRPPGVLHFYDISDPRTPRLVHRVDDAHTARFREAHSMPVALMGDREIVAIQTIDGVQFWDLTRPLEAAYVSEIDLPGVSGGDYDNVAWQADWQGHFLFVSGANQGVYVIDTQDIDRPVLLEQVATGRMGGFRVGPLFARGPYLVIGNMDQDGALSVLDITEPSAPNLLSTLSNLPRLYTMAATGDRIYGAGRDGDFTIHSFADPTLIEQVSVTRIEQDSLYVAPQDHFVYSGRQNNFVKIDITDENAPRIVSEGTLSRPNPDHGQVTPIGNWLFIGNDHGTGSALFCHALTDDLPPTVQKAFPPDNAIQQDEHARVTLVFSDYLDTRTISTETVQIRPNGGAPLDGAYTYNFNTLSFSPSAPFAPETTYEVVLPAGGVRDVMGNPLAEDLVYRFSTSDVVEAPIEPEPEPQPVDAGAGAGSNLDAGGLVADAGLGSIANPDAAAGDGGATDGGASPVVAPADTSFTPGAPSPRSSGCAARAGAGAAGAWTVILVLLAVCASRRRRA